MENVDISIVIVSYNTEALLHDVMTALRRASAGLAVEIVFIDNASKDGSVELIRREFPNCKLIVNQVNRGFGRANNQALEHVRGRYVLLLNTDAFVSPDTLEKTVVYMDAHPRCGILGVRLVGRDGVLQPSARYFPTPWNLFLQRTGLKRFFKGVRMVDDMDWDHASVRHCDWVPGCYYLVRRALIDQIGLFDPRYFLYYEEVDHCLTAKKAGWEVVFYPDSSVVHIGGESAGSESDITRSGHQIEALQIESELLFFRKNHGLFTMLADAVLSSLADGIAVARRLLKGSQPAELAACWGRMVLVWSLLVRTRLGARPTR